MTAIAISGVFVVLLLFMCSVIIFRNRPPPELPDRWKALLEQKDEPSDHGLIANLREDVGHLRRS